MVIISRDLCRLFFLSWSSLKAKSYPISVGGDESPTKQGFYKIVERWLYPRYKVNGGKIYYGTKTQWTGIGPMQYILADIKNSKSNQSIHGFINNWKHRPPYVKVHTLNYTHESSGCIRMNNEDIMEVDKAVSIGEVVVII